MDTELTVNVDTVGDDGFPALCRNEVIRTQPNPLKGYDDWFNVSLPFIQFSFSANAPVEPVPEPTDDEILRQRQGLNTADLSIATTGIWPHEVGARRSSVV